MPFALETVPLINSCEEWDVHTLSVGDKGYIVQSFKTKVGLLCFLFLFLFFFLIFRPTPEAYGSSQTRRQIRAAAVAYATVIATWDLSRVYDLHHSSQQCQILDLLSKAKD